MYICNISGYKKLLTSIGEYIKGESFDIKNIEILQYSVTSLEGVPHLEIQFLKNYKNPSYDILEAVALNSTETIIENIEIIDTTDEAVIYHSTNWNYIETYFCTLRNTNVFPDGSINLIHIK